jgi:ferredoxin
MRAATALRRIAGRHGRPVPSHWLPKMTLGDCGAHGVCARVCPTGALERREAGGVAELHFQASRCISCGQCAGTCPDKAIRVHPVGGTPTAEILARWEAKPCTSCGEPFFGSGGGTCSDCQKSQQLFKGIAALFRPSA